MNSESTTRSDHDTLVALNVDYINSVQFGDVSRFNVEILPALFRLILLHSAKLWKESGYRAVRLWCHNIRQELGQVLDYLAGEGEAAGYPQRNSTWPSLLARTKDWHDRQYIERLARARDECGAHAREWTSALPETEIDGVTFTPLTSSYQLAVEGYEMHHCVGDYDRYCADGNARIFAVRDASGARYTLELIMQNSKPKKVEVRQLEGYCNDVPVPDLVKGAAKVLAGMYKQAMTGRAAKKARKILKEAA